MDNYGSLHPGLSVTRAIFSSITGFQLLLSQLRGQQGVGVLTVAHDLHPDVAEVRQALVIGSFLPQPDIGGLGARWRPSRQQRRKRAGGQRIIQQTSVLFPGPPALAAWSTLISKRPLGVIAAPNARMRSLRPSEVR